MGKEQKPTLRAISFLTKFFIFVPIAILGIAFGVLVLEILVTFFPPMMMYLILICIVCGIFYGILSAIQRYLLQSSESAIHHTKTKNTLVTVDGEELLIVDDEYQPFESLINQKNESSL